MRNKIVWVAIVCALIVPLLYYQLWYSPPKIESGIYQLATVFRKHQAEVWAARFTPDGKAVVSASVDSSAKVWDASTGEELLSLHHPAGLTSLDISKDGQWLVTSSYDAKVRVWKLPEGRLVHELSGHQNTVWTVCISADSRLCASAGEDKIIRTWDIASGQLKSQLKGHVLNIWDIKFNPVQAQLASGSFDKTTDIWDLNAPSKPRILAAHTQAVVALSYSADGKYLASTSDDKTIKIWRCSDWALLKDWEVPEHVQAVTFSPDGKRLLTGGRDKNMIGELFQNFMGDSEYNKGVSMRLWDIETGKILQTFSSHANDVNDVAFSNDGTKILSASADHTVMVWRLAGR